VICKDVVLQKYTNLEKDVPGPCHEMYPTCDESCQAKSIKAEEVLYAEEEEDPVPITFLKIKAEAEVSCMSVCPVLGRYHRYAEMPVVCMISISLTVHMR
jgi:hypothetical protein